MTAAKVIVSEGTVQLQVCTCCTAQTDTVAAAGAGVSLLTCVLLLCWSPLACVLLLCWSLHPSVVQRTSLEKGKVWFAMGAPMSEKVTPNTRATFVR